MNGKKHIDKTTYLISKQIKKVKTNIGKITKFENIYNGEIGKEKIIEFDSKIRKLKKKILLN